MGDGGTIHIDRQDPNKIIGCTQYGNLYKTTDGLAVNGGTYVRDARFYNNHPLFITEFSVNEADGNQVYFPTKTDIQRSLDFGDTFENIYNYNLSGGIKMTVSRELDPTVYVSGYNNTTFSYDLVIIENAATNPQATLSEGVFTSSEGIDKMTCDPMISNVIYATTFRGDILKIQVDNSGFTKESIRGNASDIVFNIVIKLPNKNTLVAGTNVGLLHSEDGGSTWVLSNQIPYCQVRDLKYREDDQHLFVFTYGRGVWATTVGTSICPPNYSGINKLIGLQNSNTSFMTDGTIESRQIINADVDYSSGTFIEFLDDFEVRFGKQFQALSDGCNNAQSN